MNLVVSKLELKKFFYRILTLILVFNLALGNLPLALASQDDSGDNLAGRVSDLSKADRDHITKWQVAANSIEEGDLSKLPNVDKNPFQLANQRIEIIGKGEISLNNFHLEIPKVSFTGLRVVYDEEKKELVFEGLRGQNERGENGVVVVRHIISGLDVEAMVKDEELLSIVDSSGALHVIPMDYVAGQVFNSPIPVMKNLWKPSKNLQLDGQKLEVKYATPGLKPPNFSDETISNILPRDSEGHIRIYSGDLFVYAGEGDDKKLVGVFARAVTYERIKRDFKALLMMLMQVYPANLSPEKAQALLADLEKSDLNTEIENQESTIPASLRKALIHFSDQQIEAAKASINQQDQRASRQFQPLNPNQWQTAFEEMEKAARKQSEMLGTQINESQVEGKSSELVFQNNILNFMINEKDFSASWKGLYSQTSLSKQHMQTVRKQSRKWVSNLKEISFKYLVPLLGTATVFGFPHVFEASETAQQIQALSWMYHNAVPDVVKDLEYRMPLLLSTISLLALWPISVANSWGIGKALKYLSASVANSSTKVAQTIRDISKNWVPLSTWQRITSWGMRIYGTLIYPAARAFIKYAIQQPSMITALSNGLNPFQKISPDSSVGKSVGISKPIRVGVSNPFLSGDKKTKAAETQHKVQAVLAERQKRVEALSWQIAAVVVAEKEKVDPALIQMVASGQLKPEDINSVLVNPKLHKQWISTQDQIYKYLKGISDSYFNDESKSITPEKMQIYYQEALKIAQQIKAQGKFKQSVRELWLKARSLLKKSPNTLLDLGLKDSQFLRTIYTNKYVSEQTEKGFVSDHIMVVLIYALIGERADLKEPSHLAADPNGLLWTSGPHWADVAMNTYAHFYVSGSKRALVFQTVRPEDSQNYEPAQYQWADLSNRREGFFRTSYEWFKNVLDPRESNLGYYAVKAFFKRFTTIQAAIFMNFFVRVTLGDQSIADAMMGWMLFFFAAQWYYGWPWDIIDRGTHLEGERIEKMKEQLKQAMATVSAGAEDPNPQEAKRKMNEGMVQLLRLYRAHNPGAIEVLSKVLEKDSASALSNQIKEQIENQNVSLLGYAARLHMAIASKNESEIIAARDALQSVLVNQGEDNMALERLNANALIDFALKENPVYTEAHPAPSWLAVSGLGAILTTVLAIPLSVKSFDPNYINMTNIGFWAAVSLGGYYLYHKALTKDGWMAKILDKIQNKGTKSVESSVRSDSMCSSLFTLM